MCHQNDIAPLSEGLITRSGCCCSLVKAQICPCDKLEGNFGQCCCIRDFIDWYKKAQIAGHVIKTGKVRNFNLKGLTGSVVAVGEGEEERKDGRWSNRFSISEEGVSSVAPPHTET